MPKDDPRELKRDRLLVEIGTHDREVGSSVPSNRDIPYIWPYRARTSGVRITRSNHFQVPIPRIPKTRPKMVHHLTQDDIDMIVVQVIVETQEVFNSFK